MSEPNELVDGYSPDDPPQGDHWCRECSSWDDACVCCQTCGKQDCQCDDSAEAWTLELQVNSRAIDDKSRGLVAAGILITPPINADFWLFRVPVSDNQAIVGFPKFMLIGIGFQHEEDWNTNLPSRCGAEEIFAHIKHNKGDDSIPDDRCIEAIRLVKRAVEELKA